ncbi:MAG: hypothetical protein GXP55_13705 [Deltaproteobacteria bacterium]|nr:hypothetical protein [Deltaproteobacteria bacterium]
MSSLAMIVALGAAGCSAEFTPATLVDEARVLGAEVLVVGDPLRTNPRPGEAADVRFEVVFAGAEQPLSWAFIACVPEPTQFGEPRCAAGTTAPSLQLEPAFGAPGLRVDVPDEATLAGARSMLVLGAICAEGPVNLDREALRACADEAGVGSVVALELRLDRDGQANAAPHFATLELDGVSLEYVPPADAAATGCSGGDAPAIPWQEDVLELKLTAAPGSRETFSALRGVPPAPTQRTEDLQVSLLTTAGSFERLFDFFDDRNAEVAQDWTPPALDDVAVDGTLVRFTFTLRDGRGGFDAATRAICLLPP